MTLVAIRRLNWDSGFFGFPVARLEVGGPLCLFEAHARLRSDGYRLAYLELDPADAATAQAAVAQGAVLVDRRIELVAAATDTDDRAKIETMAPSPSADDRDALFALALASGERSRFRIDPRIAPGRFEALYRAWIDNSIDGRYADAVLVARVESTIAGMITVRAKDGIGTIGLFAVDAAFRGRGVGGRLLRGALGWFHERGAGTVRVATQGSNAGALAVYRAAGFTIDRTADTYHLWIDQ